MRDEKKAAGRDPVDVGRLAGGLKQILAADGDARETLELIVREASAAVGCGHIFLSRYDAAGRTFRAVAWQSSVSPGDVPLDRKFMGSSYLSGQPILARDLSQYNYRLRPGVARLGFHSMAGLPLMSGQDLLGVLEAFAEEADHFSDLDIDLLTVFARQAAAVIERADLKREAAYRAAENEFLLEAPRLEQASLGSLLYKVGEAFAAVLGLDGIAVFGLEPKLADSPLQEVMAKGFSMSDIGRLKSLYSREYLQKLPHGPEEGEAEPIIKQSFRQGGSAAKMLYTVPVLYRRTLYGLVVFYWRQLDKAADTVSLEQFIERMVGHIAMVLGRRDIYANIQRISLFDLLTGLANRRLFDYVLDRELKKLRRNNQPLSLLMADVDYFKKINDLYGHQTGDAVLEQIGAVMRECFRNIDLPTRYGGEEFAVILTDTDADQAREAAERFRASVAACKFLAGSSCISVTVSVGGATYGYRDTGGETSVERLIAAADQALYQAKQRGRNMVVFADGC